MIFSSIRRNPGLWPKTEDTTQRNRMIWFLLSLALASLYGMWALQQAFASEYVVQDDARQHIFWMQRFVDPDLFSNDLIADYFQGVAPLGYRWLYQFAAMLGIQPMIFGKALPFFLGLITTSYVYWLALEFFPVSFAGFISAVSFSQSIWYSSEHASGTPRAFLYPLLFAFIYYLIRERLLICWLSLTLQALFYPQISLICLGVLALRLIDWKPQTLTWASNRQPYVQFVAGMCTVGGILLYAQTQGDFGAVISRAEAIALPEFQPSGRNAFFGEGFDFWLKGRSGLFHERGFTPVTLIPGFVLPLLVWLPIKSRFREQVSPKTKVLLHVLLVSLGLFCLAHLLLFQLHLPSRYTSHTLRAIIGLTCGMSWMIILDDLTRLGVFWQAKWLRHRSHEAQPKASSSEQVMLTALSTLLAFFIVMYPALFLERFPKVGYYDFSGQQQLYQYFAAQPKGSKIASLSIEASNIPSFSAQTVLVSPEHAIAYHKGYYSQFRQRAEDLIQAHYTSNPALLAKATKAYGIDFWLLDQTAFDPAYVSQNDWLMQYQPMADIAIRQLEEEQPPILQQAISTCTVASAVDWVVLAGPCVYAFAEQQSDRPLTLSIP